MTADLIAIFLTVLSGIVLYFILKHRNKVDSDDKIERMI
jgi:hypothetical protein